MKRLIALLALVMLSVLRLHAQSSVIPITNPHVQYLSSTGDPLAGGCIFTYAAGTATPQATFQDSAGAVQNSNPIVLDSSGSANIWLGAFSYKFIYKTAGGTNCSTGSTLYTIDNIPGAGTSSSSTAFNTITAGSNSNAGTFLMSGNTLDLRAATVDAPSSAGYSPTVNSQFGYDTTANKWVFGQGSATKSFGLASVGACPANQFVSTPATAIAAAICSAPTISGSTCNACTITNSSLPSGNSWTGGSIASTTFSGTSTNSGTFSGGAYTSPTLNNPGINGGIFNAGTGFQHLRFSSCMIGSISCGGTQGWNASFSDSSYSMTCTVMDSGGFGDLIGIFSKRAGDFDYTMTSTNGSFSTPMEVDCIGVHD